MLIYTTYQCSVCRRKKDILNDNVRVTPNQCIITKGCKGRLFNIGQTSSPSPTLPAAGVIDWYPRGEISNPVPITSIQPSVSLSCSKAGVLTLAIYQSDATAIANPTLTVNLNQQRVQDISYQQYLFTVALSTNTISGRDSTGKNLRFDASTDIARELVFVLVNGVARFQGPGTNEITLTDNTVTFGSSLPVGTVVSVAVYLESNVIPRPFTFTANNTLSTSGSWGNVKWLEEYQASGSLKPNKWWLYSYAGLGAIEAGSQLVLNNILLSDGATPVSLTSARFLLSSIPHENTDRYLNFFIDPIILNEGYALSSVVTGSITELYADTGALVEIYPPFQLIQNSLALDSSFTTPDTFITVTTIPTDLGNTRLVGSKIIGPT